MSTPKPKKTKAELLLEIKRLERSHNDLARRLEDAQFDLDGLSKDHETLLASHTTLNEKYLESQGNMLRLMDENQKIRTERLIQMGEAQMPVPVLSWWDKLWGAK